jgi:sulfoxide reductase heme-binding subunit YedZ
MIDGHVFWLISRAAGITAVVGVSVSTLLGLILANGLVRQPQQRKNLGTFHEHAANAALIAIAIHGAALLGDGFLKPSVIDVLLPLSIDYRPASVATAIIGGYAAALLGLSFYIRKRIKPKRWRKLHRATPIVYVLALVHTLGAGTDQGSATLRAVMLASALPIAALSVKRLMPRPKPSKISVIPTEI